MATKESIQRAENDLYRYQKEMLGYDSVAGLSSDMYGRDAFPTVLAVGPDRKRVRLLLEDDKII